MSGLKFEPDGLSFGERIAIKTIRGHVRNLEAAIEQHIEFFERESTLGVVGVQVVEDGAGVKRVKVSVRL